jgi:hypothetical protein
MKLASPGVVPPSHSFLGRPARMCWNQIRSATAACLSNPIGVVIDPTRRRRASASDRPRTVLINSARLRSSMLSSKRRSAPMVIRGIDHVIVGSILLVRVGPLRCAIRSIGQARDGVCTEVGDFVDRAGESLAKCAVAGLETQDLRVAGSGISPASCIARRRCSNFTPKVGVGAVAAEPHRFNRRNACHKPVADATAASLARRARRAGRLRG